LQNRAAAGHFPLVEPAAAVVEQQTKEKPTKSSE
jgi:hypothetical protein